MKLLSILIYAIGRNNGTYLLVHLVIADRSFSVAVVIDM